MASRTDNTGTKSGKNNSEKFGETLYLVLTDVKDSCHKDDDPARVAAWRACSFCTQLEHLLSTNEHVVLKSIGDSLFVLVKNSGQITAILENVYIAFHECNNCKKCRMSSCRKHSPQNRSKCKNNTEIRAVIHKIKFGEQNRMGNDVVAAIEAKNIDGGIMKKAKRLIDSLKNDIFGKEVNRASRILDIPTEAVVLVTNDVVQDVFVEQCESYSSEEKDEAKSHILANGKLDVAVGDKHYHIHTPVPLTHLKGFTDISIESPYLVWHFSKSDGYTEAILAQEYREKQSFRILLTRLMGSKQLSDSKISTEIYNEVLDLLNKNGRQQSFKFYTICFWNIVDYFELQDVNFLRLMQDDKDKLLKSKKCTGQTYELTIETPKDSTNAIVNLSKTKGKQDYMLASVIIDSYHKRSSSQLNRELYELKDESEGRNLVKFIEPQTIDIFSDNVFVNVLTENINGGCFLLVFYRFFFNHKMESINKYFNSIDNLKIDNEKITPILRGTLTGLLDAFVVYELKGTTDSSTHDKIFEEAIKEILSYTLQQKGLLGSKMAGENFYSLSYPTSIFILKKNDKFPYTQ